MPGADLDGVLYLRRVEDSDRIKDGLPASSRVAVIGAGWIGLETAAAARAAGVEVTVLERAELPLLRVLGREVAQVFADLHREHGVDLRCGVQVAEITGSEGRADGVRLADGSHDRRPTRSSSGSASRPTASSPSAAGLEVDNGISVDAQLRTSDPDIYAAGDVANAFHPLLGQHIRVEHWANALHQPQTAAKAMLGQDVAYDRVPYFFTDQYDLGMEYSGYVEPGGYDQVVFRGDVGRREFIAFWLSGRPGAGRHERQHLGRHRRDPGTGPLRPAGRPGRAPGPGSPAGVTHRPLISRPAARLSRVSSSRTAASLYSSIRWDLVSSVTSRSPLAVSITRTTRASSASGPRRTSPAASARSSSSTVL